MKFENKLEYIILILLLIAIVVILLYKYFHSKKTLEGFEDSPKQDVVVDVAQLSEEIKQIGNFISGNQPSEQITEQITEQTTEQITEQTTEQIIEQPTEQPTEQPMEQPTEQLMETKPPTELNSQVIEPTEITNSPFQSTPAPTVKISIFDGLKKVHNNLTDEGILIPSSTSQSTVNTTVNLTKLSEKIAPLIEYGMNMYGSNYNLGMNNNNHIGMNNNNNHLGMNNNNNYGEHNFAMMNNGYSDPTQSMGMENGLEQHNFSTVNGDATSNMIYSRLDQNLDMLHTNSGEFNLDQPLTTFNEGQLQPSLGNNKCDGQKNVSNIFRPEINIITADRKYKHQL